MNPRKLEHGFRRFGAGIPYSLPEGNEDIDVPTFWLLLYGTSNYPEPLLELLGTPHVPSMLIDPLRLRNSECGKVIRFGIWGISKHNILNSKTLNPEP